MVAKKHLECSYSYYGPDRHQMAKMWEEGIRVRDEGGVWIEDHNDTWQLNGTTKQTFISSKERVCQGVWRLLRGGGWYMVPILITSLLVFMFGHFHWDSELFLDSIRYWSSAHVYLTARVSYFFAWR